MIRLRLVDAPRRSGHSQPLADFSSKLRLDFDSFVCYITREVWLRASARRMH